MMELVIKCLNSWRGTPEVVEHEGLLIGSCLNELMVLGSCVNVIVMVLLSIWVLYDIGKSIWWAGWWPIFDLNGKGSNWEIELWSSSNELLRCPVQH